MIVDGCEDILWDFGMMEYLFCGTLPDSPEERDRIRTVSDNYRAHGNDLQRRLPQLQGLPGKYRWATVPPVHERQSIVRDTHNSMGHTGRDKLLADLVSVWYWPNMRNTVEAVLHSCSAC